MGLKVSESTPPLVRIWAAFSVTSIMVAAVAESAEAGEPPASTPLPALAELEGAPERAPPPASPPVPGSARPGPPPRSRHRRAAGRSGGPPRAPRAPAPSRPADPGLSEPPSSSARQLSAASFLSWRQPDGGVFANLRRDVLFHARLVGRRRRAPCRPSIRFALLEALLHVRLHQRRHPSVEGHLPDRLPRDDEVQQPLLRFVRAQPGLQLRGRRRRNLLLLHSQQLRHKLPRGELFVRRAYLG